MRRYLLIAVLCSRLVDAATWSKWNGITVGSSSGNVSKWGGGTIGTSTGNIGAWNGLASPSGGGGGGSPTFVSAGTDFTGGGSLSISVTAGDHLVVWTVANDRTTGHTCSGGGNTYVVDGANVLGTGSTAIVGNLMHVTTIASTATITISCTGTTPLVAAIQYSGGTGALDTASSGTNPSSATGSSSPLTPAAFTPTTAATILVDGYGDLGGGTVTLAQVDTNYTTQGSCLTGATCFIGAIGTRVVSSSASYSDGYSFTGSGSGSISINAAYK